MKILICLPFELLFWITALLLLGTADLHVHEGDQHFTLCPLSNMGISWCPGCGIGKSIGYLLQGNFQASLNEHWFGIPALLIILNRIMVLIKIKLNNRKVLNLKYKEEGYV
ncbi:DUF2752 domain-containing protein [Pedobacter sp. ASV1-7]|uniref:DUF2752 domain-containing protein n=1 Tax=Pedobacter sp. ASV1-7 TaxID=3145237 RepID=UPI0032E8507D